METSSEPLARLPTDVLPPEDVSWQYVGQPFATSALMAAAGALRKEEPRITLGLMLSTTANVDADGTLNGYVMGLDVHQPVPAALMAKFVGKQHQNALLTTTAVYPIQGIDPETAPPDRGALADNNRYVVKGGFDADAVEFRRQRPEGVRLSTTLDGGANDALAVNPYPMTDRDYVSVVQGRQTGGRGEQWFVVVRSSLPSLSIALVEHIAEKQMTVAQILASEEWQHADALNRAVNARIAFLAAERWNVPIDAHTSAAADRKVGVPISTWQQNIFDAEVLPADSAASPTEATIGVFYQRTFNTARGGQRGVLLGISPTEGMLWVFGPQGTGPAGAHAHFGGTWENRASLNMFPTGTGRMGRWADVQASEIPPETREVIRRRVTIGGPVAATERMYPLHAQSITPEMHTAMASLGYKPSDGSMYMATIVTHMGPPSAYKCSDARFMLAWTDREFLPIPVAGNLMNTLLAEYSKEKRNGVADGPFSTYDLGTLFASEDQATGVVMIPRNLVKMAVDIETQRAQ